MSSKKQGGGKLPGKTLYAGRRRAMTRTSGFRVRQGTTGGQFRRECEKRIPLLRGEAVTVTFLIAGHRKGDLIGYGVWFWHSAAVVCVVAGGYGKRTLTEYGDASWNKAGSIWVAQDASTAKITLTFTAKAKGAVAIYEPMCGRIRHAYLDGARPALLRNMYAFAPEALFIPPNGVGKVAIEAPKLASKSYQPLILKSCNRCGRYLPINVPLERDQLSFSNHCVAPHRRPCKHATFGRLHNVVNKLEILQLEYGYQLECRFCKKFAVNAPLNPQRTAAQMKEDGARRRAFELLLQELYRGTPQLHYREETGTELAEDIWNKFGRACFKCGAALPTSKDMNLDHTRPLALLWPLDRTATALCKSCNSEKRDRAPSNFYSPVKLAELARITGIPLSDLAKTTPNEDALASLLSRLDWFFDEFMLRDEMTKERDGKVAGELVVKALQKVLARSKLHKGVNLQAEYGRRRASMH